MSQGLTEIIHVQGYIRVVRPMLDSSDGLLVIILFRYMLPNSIMLDYNEMEIFGHSNRKIFGKHLDFSAEITNLLVFNHVITYNSSIKMIQNF